MGESKVEGGGGEGNLRLWVSHRSEIKGGGEAMRMGEGGRERGSTHTSELSMSICV